MGVSVLILISVSDLFHPDKETMHAGREVSEYGFFTGVVAAIVALNEPA